MFEDFHPDINDPQYVEKLRALYPDIPNPELILDLGYQVIYPVEPLPQSEKPSETSKESPSK
jgi:hypothetical protein